MEIFYYQLKDFDLEDVCIIIAFVPDDTEEDDVEKFIEQHFGEYYVTDEFEADEVDSYLDMKAAQASLDWRFERVYLTEIYA